LQLDACQVGPRRPRLERMARIIGETREPAALKGSGTDNGGRPTYSPRNLPGSSSGLYLTRM
jgi:hypothetical protein